MIYRTIIVSEILIVLSLKKLNPLGKLISSVDFDFPENNLPTSPAAQ